MADGKVIIDSDLRAKGVIKGLRDIKNRINSLNKSMLKASALSSAIALSPSLVPMIGSAVGAAGGLSSAFASAGVGAVAFGALAVTALNDVFAASEEITKAQEELTKATTAEERQEALKKMEEAMAGLSEEQKKALKSLRQFKEFWSGFAKEFEPGVLTAFSYGLETLQYVLEQLKPAFEGATKAVVGLMEDMNSALRADDVKAIFQYLNDTAGPMLRKFGQIFGYVFRGIMNMMVAFAPLGMDMTNGMLDMAKAFSEWAASLKESEAFNSFVEYTKTNGPIVLGVIGNLVQILTNLGIALAPVGEAALGVLNIFTDLIAVLLAGDPVGQFVIKMQEASTNLISVGMSLISNMITGLTNAMPFLIEFAFNIITQLVNSIAVMMPQIILLGVTILSQLIQGLITALPQLLAAAVTIITSLVTAVQQYLPMIIAMGITLLNTLISGIIQQLPFLMTAALTLITTLITTLLNNLPRILQMGVKLLLSLIDGVMKMLPKLITTAAELIKNIVSTIIENLPFIIESGVEVLNALIDGIIDMLPMLIDTAIDLVVSVMETILNNLPKIIAAGIDLLNALIDGIIDALPQLINAALDLIFAIVDTLIANLDDIIAAGIDLLGALVVGLVQALPELWGMVRDDLIGGLLDRLNDINLFEIGANIIRGLINGIQSLDIPTPHFSVTGGLDLNPAGGMSLPSVGVDWYKDGGLFAPNSPRLIGIGDASVPEAALPLKPSVLGMIGDRIAATMGGTSGSSGGPSQLTLILGGIEYDAFIEDVTEAQERQEFRLKRKR